MISGATGAIAVVIVALAISRAWIYICNRCVSRNNSDFSGFIQVRKADAHSSTSRNLWFCKWISNNYFMSQLNQFKDASGNWLTGQSLYILVGLLLTMLIISTQAYKSYPCFINCNFGCFWIVVGFGIDTKTVGDIASIQGGFPPFTYPIYHSIWKP
jgi:SulP family sulfate permease